MKVALAQIKPIKGDVERNIKAHLKCIEIATSYSVDLIFFPELSITGYEPDIADNVATTESDSRFKTFQQVASNYKVNIGIGVPIKHSHGVQIGMLFFTREGNKHLYCKQYLHRDEKLYFNRGEEQLYLNIGSKQIAPAICYESLLDVHIENAVKNGATCYIASVAKPQEGVQNAYNHFRRIASKFSIPILMTNSIGYCDNFESAGQSAYWNDKGELLYQLNKKDEGILIVDIKSEELIEKRYF